MGWNSPDDVFWLDIVPYTGAVYSSARAERGYTADVTLTAECELGPLFIKGYRLPTRDMICFERESAINAHVLSVSPRLLWQHISDTWAVLGFERAPGSVAHFSPGSPDLPAVIDVLNRLASIECPVIALDEDWAEWRFDRFTDTPELFAGNALLHSDIAPGNFLIHDGSAMVVDWAYPTRGAGFIDVAQLVVQLISSGRTPEDAEGWAERCKAWQSADSAAIDAFAAADLRLQQWAAESRPDEEWHTAMVRATADWLEYRKAR